MYVKETIQPLDKLKQRFITRAPQKLKESKTLINNAPNLDFTEMGNGYSGVWHHSNYGDVEQKWLLLLIQQTRKREFYGLNKRILKTTGSERKAFKKLSQQRFACQDDAQKKHLDHCVKS